MTKEKLLLVKVGGKVVENPEALNQLITDLSNLEGRKVLVHGGGVLATKTATALGIETTMVEGRRVTDDKMIDVVTMVYAGLVNKRVVSLLQSKGTNAIGLCGADMNVILSDKRPVKTVDYGWVGDVKKVDGKALSTLIESGVVPVLAPLTHDGQGHILNTNADTIAAETAKGLAAYYDVTLVFCFEKRGVLADANKDNSVITSLNREEYEAYKSKGVITDGMIPKLDNAFSTLEDGVCEVVITHASSLNDLTQGTHIK
ncbi:MAG: acetylglutamate kinase [Bacteroidales bacterium]|nr:acetylglutamate kinase [Bacteroidales bacterium]